MGTHGRREFGAASARLLAKLREVPHPFADDLEEGITVWQLSRAASRAIASLDLVWQHLGARATMPVLELRAEYAYVILNASYGGDGDAGEPSDATEEMHLERAQGDAQLRIRIHHWVGAKASHDARGAVAVLSIHLLQALESSDCTARLYLEEEAQESSVFLSYFPEQVLRVVAAASSAPVNRAARREEREQLREAALEAAWRLREEQGEQGRAERDQRAAIDEVQRRHAASAKFIRYLP